MELLFVRSFDCLAIMLQIKCSPFQTFWMGFPERFLFDVAIIVVFHENYPRSSINFGRSDIAPARRIAVLIFESNRRSTGKRKCNHPFSLINRMVWTITHRTRHIHTISPENPLACTQSNFFHECSFNVTFIYVSRFLYIFDWILCWNIFL